MTFKTIDGDSLPPELKEALIGHVTGRMNAKRENPYRPARLADLQSLLEGDAQPTLEVGDIVVLRPHATNQFKWPTGDDRCIVTQVLATPWREGEAGTAQPGQRNDITLAFVGADDRLVYEFLHDSRNFKKVASIYDPVTLPSGEQIPTT